MTTFVNRCSRVVIQGIIGAFLVRIPVAFIMSRQIPVSMFHITVLKKLPVWPVSKSGQG